MVLGWLAEGKSQILCAETQPGLKKYLEITFTIKKLQTLVNKVLWILRKTRICIKSPN